MRSIDNKTYTNHKKSYKMSTLNTKVISARVPIEFANNLTDYCSRQGITISKYLQDGFSSTPADGANFDKISVPDDTIEFLTSVAGGGACAVLGYKGIKWALEGKYDEDTVNMLAFVGAAAVGLLSALGIKKLLK